MTSEDEFVLRRSSGGGGVAVVAFVTCVGHLREHISHGSYMAETAKSTD